ncbi:MAG TPA: CmcJ/NvfI family oxidoreductase [Candidatus Binataceae bacterium]|nr:CmcJ/NvfI family oxidoreductase [Candidatus Binataceae bacterium]
MASQVASQITAPLNYLGEMDEAPYSYRYAPPAGVPMTNVRHDPRPQPIHDGRPLVDELSLDRQGFMLLRSPTMVRDFYDEQEVRAVYYPEIEALAKSVTGAEKVLIFDHTLRCAALAKRGERGAREPVRNVHNDYTANSGPQRVRDLLEPAEAKLRLSRRFAEINVWRPLSGPVLESPLAICDARTIAPEDLIPNQLRYRDRNGETYSARFNPNHRWYYFPRMERDEVVLLKCYDSALDGRARFTIHTAFDDPTSPPWAPARESIEARMLLFFAATAET